MFANESCRLHFVCLSCRRSVKRAANVRSASQMRGEKWDTPAIRCAICQGELMCMGRKFAAPKRNDEAGWKKLEWMIEQGWRGGVWPTLPAMNLNPVRDTLLAEREARILEMKRQASRFVGRSRAARASQGARATQSSGTFGGTRRIRGTAKLPRRGSGARRRTRTRQRVR